MKKTHLTWLMVAGLVSLAQGQMPTGGGTTALPSSFDASGSGAKPKVDDPNRRGESPPPQLLGMELPLMDPSTDTMSYNGGIYDVGNNAVVRERFEKYLQQVPDDSAESKRYRSIINKIIRQTEKSAKDRRYVIGSEVLINIGHSLYDADKYPGDGGQSGMLASAIVSALDSQRSNLKRDRQSAQYEKDMRSLTIKADGWKNASERRKDNIALHEGAKTRGSAKGGGGGAKGSDTNVIKVAQALKELAAKQGKIAANSTANETNTALAKTNYQSTLVMLLLSRRFDHAMIGSRIYRHIFRGGDARLDLDKDSKMNEVFMGGVGMPPTVNTIDSLASNARADVDKSIEAVHSMLAQNKLGEATQHLIAAVAIGEFMQSVATFPTEGRRRIAHYWTLRKKAFVSLNARDYDAVEKIAEEMKTLDVDFNDSLLLSYTTGKKRQSDFAIRNAAKALRSGNEEDFRKYIEEAGIIWPRNPKLEQGEEMIAKYDQGDDVKDEFRNLFAAKEYRKIVRDKERFKIVAMDEDLAKQYEEALMLVMKMDGLLEQIRVAAKQDATLGPCMAYEKLVQWQKDEPRYAEDTEMRIALKDFESKAHDFVQALWDGQAAEERRELGSALSCYYRAQCKYPHSEIAREGIQRVMNIIVKAQYDE